MANLLEHLQFSFSVTGPICIVLFLGMGFKYFRLINDNFIEVASKLVFKVTLPALLFFNIVDSDHQISSSIPLLVFALVANVAFFIFTSVIAKRCFDNPSDQGVIIQGGFRANTGIVGLAYVANAYGNGGIAIAAIYVACTTFCYNILAVIALSPKGNQSGAQSFAMMGKTMTKNPLIISIVAGVACKIVGFPIPTVVSEAGHYFAHMTLPLALLCTGGALNLRALKADLNKAWFASGFRLVLAPLMLTIAGYLCGFRGVELGVIFLMSAAPTAAASYVMARAMNANANLAANIIALTTLLSLISCTLGIAILSQFGLISA